jgi:hypothetical protein
MKLLKNPVTVTLTIAAFALSGAAWAATEKGNDTVLNYAYDEDSHFWIMNVTSLEFDAENSESLSEEAFQALLEACGLEDEAGTEYDYTVEFDAEGKFVVTVTPVVPEEEGEEGSEEETIECGEFTGDFVTGPAGQVNHGMFMKTFNQLYDGPNRGCLVRHIAKSNLGKGDQQVLASDDEEDTEEPEEVDEVVAEGTVTFTTVGADCLHGGGADDGDNGGGPPQHVLDKFGGQHPRDAHGKPNN